MKTVRRDRVYREHSRFNEPSLVVSPGEEFMVETELCSGRWLQTITDRWSYAKGEGPNPSVCVGIDGAKEGSVLAVTIQHIAVEDLGYTGFDGRYHDLAHLIHRRDWGVPTKTLRIADGFVEWDTHRRLPVRPMIGTLGTAPRWEALANSKGGPHGGNMDVNEVTTGTTVYLPVYVQDALLHIGDVHALQGDGEINGAGGVECRATVQLTVDIRDKPSQMQWVRLEDENYIMTVACCRSVEESFYRAAEEMLLWMTDAYGFDPDEAYLLMGQVLEARCTQFVNPTRSYICKVRKEYLR